MSIGLCENCRHAQIVQNSRGGTFYLCRRANEDASFPKYPRLPLLSCRGYEAEPPKAPEGATPNAHERQAFE